MNTQQKSRRRSEMQKVIFDIAIEDPETGVEIERIQDYHTTIPVGDEYGDATRVANAVTGALFSSAQNIRNA